jgi:hypothetical protein
MPLTWILLRNLLACERGLVEGYSRALRKSGRSPRETELMTAAMEAHQRHARILGERLARLGEPPPELADDLWITDPDDPRALMYSEQASHDTWHDALLDFPPEFADGDARHIVHEHHELMRAWEALLAVDAEPSVTV